MHYICKTDLCVYFEEPWGFDRKTFYINLPNKPHHICIGLMEVYFTGQKANSMEFYSEALPSFCRYNHLLVKAHEISVQAHLQIKHPLLRVRSAEVHPAAQLLIMGAPLISIYMSWDACRSCHLQSLRFECQAGPAASP